MVELIDEEVGEKVGECGGKEAIGDELDLVLLLLDEVDVVGL